MASDKHHFPFEQRRKGVRDLRRQLKMSQSELAKLVGITQESISGFERGKHDISVETQQRITGALAKAAAQRQIAAQKVTNMVKYPDYVLDPTKYDEQLQRFQESTYGYRNPALPDRSRDTRDRVMEKLIEAQQSLIGILHEIVDLHKEAGSEKDKRITELEERVALLSDLLNVETTKGVAQSEADDLREQLSSRNVKE